MVFPIAFLFPSPAEVFEDEPLVTVVVVLLAGPLCLCRWTADGAPESFLAS